jgi:hypothetical protein
MENTAGAPAEIQLTGKVGKKGAWTLARENDTLLLKSTDSGEKFVFTKNDFHIKITLREKGAGGPLLVINTPKRCGFTLNKNDVQAVREWLGPLTSEHLRLVIKQAGKWTLPVVILFFAFAALEYGTLLCVINASLGLSLLLVFIASKFFHHPVILLLYNAWGAGLIGSIVFDIVHGGLTVLSIPLIVFLLICLVFGVREYGKFRTLSGG